MNAECYPISVLPGTTALFRDYAEPAESEHAALLRRCYPTRPFTMAWATNGPVLERPHRERLAEALLSQTEQFGAGAAARDNIERLRSGAAAVVTGQQVGLLGGPLLTLLKAATAIRKAQDATKASGREHVPVFWLATEDHDIAEVDQVALLTKTEVQRKGANLHVGSIPVPVGGIATGDHMEPVLDWAEQLLGFAPICATLREAYSDHGSYKATLASGFARLLSHIFAEQGLVVMDATGREFHALGERALRAGLERADELEEALLRRSAELESAGYHAQVLVTAGHSLLFLITVDEAGVPERWPLRRTSGGGWKAGGREFSTAELVDILEREPERLSPNALLRSVFQDCILPTAAYVGGPSEVAYFAQSAVVYERVLGRVTPVLPRLTATLIEPSIAHSMASHEVQFLQVLEAKTAGALALRLGARAMPIEGKRKIAAVGNAMGAELSALAEYMAAMSAELGRAAEVSASKMRYQMDRLRRMAAAFEVQKQDSLNKHARAIMLNLLPGEHLQERVLAGVWFLARYGEGLPQLLVEHAGQECPGHRVIYL
jgi:bacillithiol biosynthesis cysteine-adding enzyme BshC